MAGFFSTVGDGVKGLLSGLRNPDTQYALMAARSIADGDYATGSRIQSAGQEMKLERQKLKAAEQERWQQTLQEIEAIAAMEQGGFTPEEIAIARQDLPEFAKRYVERFGTNVISQGSTLHTGGPGGTRTTFTAPRSDVINNDVISTDLNNGTSRKVYEGPAPTKVVMPGGNLVNDETGANLFQSEYKPQIIEGDDGKIYEYRPGQPDTNPHTGRLPRGLRNNNPGNIEDGGFARSLPGYAGSDGRFAVFETPEAGKRAMHELLTRYIAGGTNSVASIVSKWAPPKENGAATAAYINHVARRIGVKPGARLDYDQIRDLADAMVEFENGGASGGGKERGRGGLRPIVDGRGTQLSPEKEAEYRAEAEAAIARGADPRKVYARLNRILGGE